MDTLKIEWEGADGSIWDLIDPRSPVHAVSLEGLGMPGLTNQWTQSAAYDGQRYESTSWGSNIVTMTIHVGDIYPPAGAIKRRTGDAWRVLDRAFRKSISAEKEGRLIVTSDVGRRYLNLRLDGPVSFPSEMNPALMGKAVYVLAMTAGDEPWWTGDPIPAEFPWEGPGHPFFGGPGGEDLLYISASNEKGRGEIVNPGDREAWPVWWAEGPVEGVQIGVGGEFANIPITLGANQRIYVDSRRETITNEDGDSLWLLMGFEDPIFAPIPARGEAELYVRLIEGRPGSAVGLSLVPRYDGPW